MAERIEDFLSGMPTAAALALIAVVFVVVFGGEYLLLNFGFAIFPPRLLPNLLNAPVITLISAGGLIEYTKRKIAGGRS